ncbi:MAG TPA: radical SAM protein [Clostridia bacterium]|nr:radical SAM protein [Clostridia bacterium]
MGLNLKTGFKAGDEDLIRSAWETARASFGWVLGRVLPSDTAVVSLTGESCALNCAHCGGHYLKGMLSAARAIESGRTGLRSSCLVSGGCTPDGRVPLIDNEEILRDLYDAYAGRLNFHVGLIGPKEAELLKRLSATVSFDLVGDDETVREVFGLNRTARDYVASLALLRSGVRVFVHICIGLRGGELSGEYDALRALQRLHQSSLAGLVFIVFIPTRGTRFSDRQPPPIPDVVRLIGTARHLFPKTPIYLGCMRPGGIYRKRLDMLAVMAGVQRIVNPFPSALQLATTLGLSLETRRECCVLE